MRELMLIVHFIGLAMALGAGFANIFLGSVAAKLEPAERGSFMSKIVILARMGQTGLGLLLLSGFYMITPFWKTLGEMPFLIAKLSLVVILIGLVSWIGVSLKKAKANPALYAKIKPVGMLNFFVGITIVIMAVLSFR